jgi:uncharacterized protein YebE (UPF0316 family)
MLNAILIFAIATVVNVTLSTIRSLCTIKGGKWVSAISNAVCYGFYPLIVMLTAKGTVDIIVNMTITAVANFVCVWIIKYIEEKAKKDKLWKVEIALDKDYTTTIHHYLERRKIPHNYLEVGSWVMFNCYCATQEDTKLITQLAKTYNGKISAYESQLNI